MVLVKTFAFPTVQGLQSSDNICQQAHIYDLFALQVAWIFLLPTFLFPALAQRSLSQNSFSQGQHFTAPSLSQTNADSLAWVTLAKAQASQLWCTLIWNKAALEQTHSKSDRQTGTPCYVPLLKNLITGLGSCNLPNSQLNGQSTSIIYFTVIINISEKWNAKATKLR